MFNVHGSVVSLQLLTGLPPRRFLVLSSELQAGPVNTSLLLRHTEMFLHISCRLLFTEAFQNNNFRDVRNKQLYDHRYSIYHPSVLLWWS